MRQIFRSFEANSALFNEEKRENMANLVISAVDLCQVRQAPRPLLKGSFAQYNLIQRLILNVKVTGSKVGG